LKQHPDAFFTLMDDVIQVCPTDTLPYLIHDRLYPNVEVGYTIETEAITKWFVNEMSIP